MPYNRCSGNFSSCPRGDLLCYSVSSCGSSSPSNLVYSTDLCSSSTCQQGSSLYCGCQETCCEPIRCQTFHVLSSACQKSCYRPRISRLCSPSWSVYTGSLKCGSSRGYILGYKSRNCYSLGCGSSGFRPLDYEVCVSPSLSCGSSFCHPIHMASRSCQTSCYQPTCIPDFYF